MARIRIVGEWLRSPVSTPSQSRAIMVVASSWSEQRVLMRAYSGSSDQTRPTIVLHGNELAIGPAGTDPHGEWGIHVQPPIDGRAQELREQLEIAARRLAGSKGNPPRLEDEVPDFEKKSTNLWAPGTAPATPEAERARSGYFEPLEAGGAGGFAAASNPASGAAAPTAAPGDRTMFEPAADDRGGAAATPGAMTVAGERSLTPVSVPSAAQLSNRGGGVRSKPAEVRRSSFPAAGDGASAGAPSSPRQRGWINPVVPRRADADANGGVTQLGFDTGDGSVRVARTSSGHSAVSTSIAHLVGHTMPLGFSLERTEREVLNALGAAACLSASEVAGIAGVENGIQWMEGLMAKLSEHGLDLIEPANDRAGEPTYALRR